MNIKENIERISAGLPEGVRLIAVSKTKPAEAIEEAYAWGQRAFGENRPQEMASKYRLLPKDIEWHMIGQLQEKNVKYIAPFVRLIHSVDSLKLLVKIEREAAKCARTIDCLLEFHIAEETTKSGLTYEQAVAIMESEEYKMLENVRITGVMGIATYTENTEQVRREFRELKQIFLRLKEHYFSGKPEFREISMGMSGDYRIAVEEGCTMVRIGSSIFGQREYQH
ncbi:YggS family pyridoxal phosphate-dependent enzyme [Odoribacter lunatus]|uniref:YggS family pyridoxal phosphate-dependent enzyme n=1 Tax=Odoribacter lunatus TaxID=2941335 RepID=UPI00203DB66B|nr:YggS family pyridoxal phosphate-dependent enzyme [Odoribacter lunatus]